MCNIANDLISVELTEKARDLLAEIVRQVGQRDEYFLKGQALDLFRGLFFKLEVPVPETLVEKIVLRHVREMKRTATADLIILIEFSREVGNLSCIPVVLAELVTRTLTQGEFFAALMFAIVLGDAELLRRFSRQLQASPPADRAEEGGGQAFAIVFDEALGLTGCRSGSNEAMLIFNSLLPDALWRLVEILQLTAQENQPDLRARFPANPAPVGARA